MKQFPASLILSTGCCMLLSEILSDSTSLGQVQASLTRFQCNLYPPFFQVRENPLLSHPTFLLVFANLLDE